MPEFLAIGENIHSGPKVRMHRHDESWEILFYTRGSGYVTIGTERIPFAPGKIVFMPQGVEHAETADRVFECLFLHCRGYSTPRGHIPVFDDDLNRSGQTLGRMILREYLLKQAGWRRVTQELFELLLLYFARWGKQMSDAPVVAELKHVLANHVHDSDFNVAAALDKIDVCSEHARRLFVRATGRTPLQYLADMRIDAAKRLLAAGGLSVKEVARSVGLPDPFYFSRLFRKRTGLSPTDFAGKMR